MPSYLSFLAGAYAELGQLDNAMRCIGEAMTAVVTTKETWFEAEVNRIAGEIALRPPEPDMAKVAASLPAHPHRTRRRVLYPCS
jgi:predicted ATPase